MKTILLLGCGLQEIRVVPLLQRAGYNVVVADRNPESPARHVADTFLLVDSTDLQTLLGALEWQRTVNGLTIDGVMTLVNLTTSQAVISDALELPGVDTITAIRTTNKALMKWDFQQAGVPCAKSHVVNLELMAGDSLSPFAQDGLQSEFETYVKPLDSFGGQGVYHVEGHGDLRYLAMAAAESSSGFSNVLVERALQGTYHDVNGLFDIDGNFYPCGIVDSYFMEEVHGEKTSPIESYVVAPSEIDSHKQVELFETFEMACRAVGLCFGPVGGDMMWTDDGPMILEIAPRFHSAPNCLYMIPEATGMRIVEAAAQVLTTGHLQDVELLEPTIDRVCVNQLLLPRPGTISEIAVGDLPERIVDVHWFKGVGDKIEYRNTTDATASIFAVGYDCLDAESAIDDALSQIFVRREHA